MKKAVIAVFSLALAAPLALAEPVKKLETDEQKTSYSFGLVFGKQLQADMPDIQVNEFLQGIRDGYTDGEALLTEEQAHQVLMDYQAAQREQFMKEREQLAAENQKAGEEFLKKNLKNKGVKQTDSGLQYKVITEGKGKRPTADDSVTVHYTGKLIDGTVFDSSVERGEPLTFPLKGVIPGWTEGLQLMKEGSKWELYIPSELAYGKAGNPVIEPNQTLVFEVELLKVQPQE